MCLQTYYSPMKLIFKNVLCALRFMEFHLLFPVAPDVLHTRAEFVATLNSQVVSKLVTIQQTSAKFWLDNFCDKSV